MPQFIDTKKRLKEEFVYTACTTNDSKEEAAVNETIGADHYAMSDWFSFRLRTAHPDDLPELQKEFSDWFESIAWEVANKIYPH